MTAGAAPRVDVEIGDPEWRGALAGAADRCRRAARAALAEAPPGGPPELCEIGVLLAGDAAVAALNRRYRGRDGATNVLAFPCAGSAPAAGAPRLLGDVVLARETVLAEARAAALPVADHVSHLVAHGVLHLLGYDHADAAGEAEMRGLEARALGRVGVPDPYRRRGGAPA